MPITIIISSKPNIEQAILEGLEKVHQLNSELAKQLYHRFIHAHFDQLSETAYFVIEAPYVDKVYRDSFYSYYSSKNQYYKRDSIRVSIFSEQIFASDFRDISKKEELQNKFMGFIVLRPTEPSLIGRSVISPKVLKIKNFDIVTTSIRTTVNSIKLSVDGFPHSSQDGETISCAETTIWSLMEYFSNRYSEYKSVLPSTIIETLNRVSTERQVPSKGLNIQQISYALREFGLGTKIYSQSEFGTSFNNLLSCYIESGIPVVVAMENRHAGGNIGHALLCIGNEPPTNNQVDALVAKKFMDVSLTNKYRAKNIILHDYNDLNERYVFIDDNHPAYQPNYLNSPSANYLPNNPHWANCEITYFIVPLYTKVYLEAFEAQNFIFRFLINDPFTLHDNSEVFIKIFLTSSRSFKDWLATNGTFDEDVKTLIIETSMPKFIWVGELSTKELIKTNHADGIIILDATEANTMYNKPLIIAAYEGNYITFASDSNEIKKFNLSLGNYSTYHNNLKSFK